MRRESSKMGCIQGTDAARLRGLHRRQLLWGGGLGLLGAGFASSLKGSLLQDGLLNTAVESRSFGQAKACIFLFMWGGPSQLDTLDMKPEAPEEIRGTFRPTSTAVPGIQICEHFTKMARLIDRVTIVRSFSHDDPAHLSSGHAALTGQLAPVIRSDDTPPSDKDSPHMGALLSKFRGSSLGTPAFVSMPWKAFHPAAPGGEAPGQHGGWLGPGHDGLLLRGDLNDPKWKPSGLGLPDGLSLAQLESRRELLSHLQTSVGGIDGSMAVESFNHHQHRAMELIASPKVRNAFDLSKETEATRDRYGRNIHGQCVLMARRLVEHGVPFVGVNWHNDGKNFWDTHGDNFNRLKNDLIPPSDMALSALIEDLEQRGMLNETLVVWVGEFGRRPQITANNAGREHWPFCYSGILAGGGIQRGAVVGASDKHAAYPVHDKISPMDLGTTILHAMGVPTDSVLDDREGRPHRVASGRIVSSLFG